MLFFSLAVARLVIISLLGGYEIGNLHGDDQSSQRLTSSPSRASSAPPSGPAPAGAGAGESRGSSITAAVGKHRRPTRRQSGGWGGVEWGGVGWSRVGQATSLGSPWLARLTTEH